MVPGSAPKDQNFGTDTLSANAVATRSRRDASCMEPSRFEEKARSARKSKFSRLHEEGCCWARWVFGVPESR